MKKHFFNILLISAVIIAVNGCQNLSMKKVGRESTVQAVVKNIAGDDLGRVMIFTESQDMPGAVFVKDFYSSSGHAGDVKKKMHEYIDSIKKFIGKKVIITYCENSIGDLMLITIKGK